MRSKTLFLLFITILIAQFSFAQSEKYQSLFIYNFTKYVKWPESENETKFVIGIFGDGPISDALQQMVNTKKKSGVGTDFVIEQYNQFSEIGNCHILFVCKGQLENLSDLNEKTVGEPILIITDSPGMGEQGAVINFVEIDGKMRFELNESMAESRSLAVSGSLASLAILI